VQDPYLESTLTGIPRPTAVSQRVRSPSAWAEIGRHAMFVSVFAFLDAMANLRYPAPEPRFWWLIPSVDVVIVLACSALWSRSGRRVPNAVRVLLVALLLLVRLVRVGDGVQEKYYAHPFNLYTDLRLVPNIVSFVRASVPPWQFALCILVAMAGLVALVAACLAALGYAERYLAEKRNVVVFVALSGFSFIAIAPLRGNSEGSDLFFGGFAASAAPRLLREARFLFGVHERTSGMRLAIARTQNDWANAPSNLAKLHGANVFLIFVESYGRAVFDRPYFMERMREPLRAFESKAVERGFTVASGTLISPTSGGHSWLAHTTLATGIDVSDEMTFGLVSESKPKTIARFFRDAGYRTVLVQPGTTANWPEGDFYQFEQKYYAWNFDYAGPAYAWATMPDQYVLDFIRRRELEKHQGPVFAEYMLVSSHAPWSALPTVVDDWDQLGNGALFRTNTRLLYPVTWPNFDNASQAYIDSIAYDVEVLKRYIASFVRDESLIVILGDHQPVAEISGRTPFAGVPVHVLSRDPSLVEPFVERGFQSGMIPPNRTSYEPMSSFLLDLLRDFSTDGPLLRH
jgi:hypothetical protein